MRVFLLDLWMDLREKRLAPVALALLAGLLIVPFVLASDEPEPPADPPPVAQEGDDLPEVKVAGENDVLESRLTAFDPRDPFEPRSAAQLPGAGGGDAGGGDAGGGATGGGGGEGGETTGAGGGTTPTGGGETGGGTTGGDTGGGTQGRTERRTTFFTFTVDVTFGEFGEERRRQGVRRLEILPNPENPVVVFLGVTSTGRTAVFLVDPGMEATGEGICRPSRDECTFLYLRDDAERNTALLTSEDGVVYRLTLRDINRVATNAQGDPDDDDNTSRGGGRSPAFTGSTRDDAPPGEPEDADDETADRKSSFRSPDFADDAQR